MFSLFLPYTYQSLLILTYYKSWLSKIIHAIFVYNRHIVIFYVNIIKVIIYLELNSRIFNLLSIVLE